MRKLFLIPIAALAVCLAGCNKWLTVDPTDKILESDALKSEQGIDNLLNGLYRDIVSGGLYGDAMTMGTVDYLAHYYDYPEEGEVRSTKQSLYNLWLIGSYSYAAATGNEGNKAFITPMWQAGYAFILNANTFIHNLENNVAAGVISEERSKLYRGEALGLRSLVHLDMYRLFGPVTIDAEATVLPYHGNPSITTPGYLTATDFLKAVLKDLDAATELMKDTDPIKTEMRSFDHHTDDDGLDGVDRFAKCFRNKRMNYWAVQVLKMRAHMLLGTTEDLNAVIAIGNEILTTTVDLNYQINTSDMPRKALPFAFNGRDQIGDNNAIIYDEVMFGPTNLDMKKTWDDHFSRTTPGAATRLTTEENLKLNIYGLTGLSSTTPDQRFASWHLSSMPNGKIGPNNNAYYYNYKYSGMQDKGYSDRESNLDYKVKDMMALIRLSEVSYMSAEAKLALDGASNVSDAITLVNDVLNRRGMDVSSSVSATGQLPLDATKENVLARLHMEYYREFVYEGQAFYFLKRHDSGNMYEAGKVGYMPVWNKWKFVLPRPDGEVDFYPNTSK